MAGSRSHRDSSRVDFAAESWICSRHVGWLGTRTRNMWNCSDGVVKEEDPDLLIRSSLCEAFSPLLHIPERRREDTALKARRD